VLHLPKRECENCGHDYWPTHPTQRWCSQWCREDFRNAELRAARKLWAAEGKPREMLQLEKSP
jgi:hypothetical protein